MARNTQSLKWLLAAFVAVITLVACTTSPTGRRQLLLFSDADMSSMGATAFDQMKKKLPVNESGSLNAYVSCVSDAITQVLPAPMNRGWEVRVFDDDSANAFALPGQKIGVHTGLFKVAHNQDQLAAVIGHEVGHVLAKHSAERMSVQFVSDSGQQLLGAIVGGSAQGQTAMSLLGLGAQYGLIMPYGRKQESESDLIGIKLMAQAGFDPRASVRLWLNMSANNQQQPPEFLSTHPSHETRITDLQQQMPKMERIYNQARASGRKPACKQ